MSSITDYLETLPAPTRAIFEHIREIAHQAIPSVEEGTSYGMPAYLYKGKPVLSAMANKHFLSVYPFSGKVIARLEDKLADYECTSGSIHFSEEHLLSDELLKEIIAARLEEIAATSA